MKIFEENRTLMSNVDNQSKMRIEASSKMFEILSSKIYKYKIAAIVRELSSNCYDSHVEAGCPEKPFTVVLPSKYHGYVEFIDYGMGMSHEDVVNIFTVYGVSTKNDSNDAIGAFGMGAKTPFAYSKSFLVETTKNGVKRFYNLFLNEQSEPSYSLQAEVDTDEPNGTKIKIPVKEDHYHKFVSEAEFILSFFPTRPEVHYSGEFDFIIPEKEIVNLREKGYFQSSLMRSNSDLYNSYSDIYAVMGPVCYPIDFSDIGIHSYEIKQKLPGIKNDLFSVDDTIFIQFDIGELEVNASREALSIEEGKESRTVENIKRKVFEINQAVEEEISEEIESSDNRVELMNKLFELNGNVFNRYSSMREVLEKITYREVPISRLTQKRMLRGVNLYKCTVPRSVRNFTRERRGIQVHDLVENYARTPKKIHVIFDDVGDDNRLTKETWLRWFGNEYNFTCAGDFVIVFKGKRSETKIERLRKIVPLVTEYETHSLSDILKHRKQALVERRQTSTDDLLDKKEQLAFKAKAVKLYPIEFSPYNVPFGTTEVKSTKVRQQIYQVQDQKNTLFLTCSDIDEVMSTHIDLLGLYFFIFAKKKYDKVVIVGRNKINKKRIDRNGLESFESVFERLKGNKKFCRLLYFSQVFNSSPFNIRRSAKMDVDETGIDFSVMNFVSSKCFEQGLTDSYLKKYHEMKEKFESLKGKAFQDIYAINHGIDMRIVAIRFLRSCAFPEYKNPNISYFEEFYEDFPMLQFVKDEVYNLSEEEKETIKNYIDSALNQ